MKHANLPGTVYADRGKLFVKIRVPDKTTPAGKPLYKKVATRLPDTPRNRRYAEDIRLSLYKELYLNAKPDAASGTLATLFSAYLSSKRLAPKTARNYALAFRAVFGDGNYPCDRATILELVRRFAFESAPALAMKPATINTYLNNVQIFFRYLHEEDCLPKPVNVFKLYKVKMVRSRNEIFTEEELATILAGTAGMEFGLLLEFMLETGARPVDALTLEWHQVQPGSITWLNKITKEEESLPCSARASAILDSLRHNPKPFRWQYSTQSRLSRTLDQTLLRLGIEKAGRSLKTFRKNFKKRISRLPYQLQMKLMRHRSPNVTLTNYESVSPAELRIALQNPVTNL